MGTGLSQKFPKRFRILSSLEFRSFRGRSQLCRLSEILIYKKPNGLGNFRVGVTIKARCSSVERVRIKRVVREAFRKLGLRLGSYDYNVVVPKEKSLSHPYPIRLKECLRNELQNALNPTHLLDL